ncbi:hypothetical protein K8O68_04780 [Salipaludibacillus sp. CUR1]|uniref:hypothetical protein n=1 Tax=Salipaludibacillus sp. CUR1 TaxID=2820003 RepID=UPI001E53FBDE|nr:hypothetical protein [Salipaludibacillus sp. CUR1]MCE7791744.1 hypothetical protein [Salipaludibacillus sp. CUR1]
MRTTGTETYIVRYNARNFMFNGASMNPNTRLYLTRLTQRSMAHDASMLPMFFIRREVLTYTPERMTAAERYMTIRSDIRRYLTIRHRDTDQTI